MPEVDVVTGAFGYTGRYITRRLLESGRSVRRSPGTPNRPNPFGDRVDVASFDFDDRRNLTEHLRGATRLYNTYWVRFPRGNVTFERAVANGEIRRGDRRRRSRELHLRGAGTADRASIGRRTLFVHVPRAAALTAATAIGRLVGDVVVTKDELDGLMAELVTTEGPATGTRALTEWLAQNAAVVGKRYASEVSRHYRSPARTGGHFR
jgi:hypothetical protein